MLTVSPQPLSQHSQRIYVNEVWDQSYGQLGPGREWAEWHVYALDAGNPQPVGHFKYEDRDSAYVNACQWAKAIGEKTIQLQKEGTDTSEIDVDQTLGDIKTRLVMNTWQC